MSMRRFDADEATARPIWLITLADLCLLLVGFFVFVQANQLDRRQLADAIRKGFDNAEASEPPLPLDRAALRGFAAADATPPPMSAMIGWVRQSAVDPRTIVTVTGSTAGGNDRDPLTGSAPILASDRARAVAAALVRAGAVPRDRIVISTDAEAHGAHVLLSIGFAGDRQSLAARQLPPAASTGANS